MSIPKAVRGSGFTPLLESTAISAAAIAAAVSWALKRRHMRALRRLDDELPPPQPAETSEPERIS